MIVERRNLIRTGLSFIALNALTSRSLLFCSGTPDYSLRDVSPDLFYAMSGLGNRILESSGATKLTGWMDSLKAAAKPPAQSFSEKWDPPIRIQSPLGGFSNVTKLADRSLVIGDLPNIVQRNSNPTSVSSINVPEMYEMANVGNSALYHVQCGCVYRLPLNSGLRREPSASDHDQFSNWIANSFLEWGDKGGFPPAYKDKAKNARLSLFYMRDFCGCYNVKLSGFAFRDLREPENPVLFAVA